MKTKIEKWEREKGVASLKNWNDNWADCVGFWMNGTAFEFEKQHDYHQMHKM